MPGKIKGKVFLSTSIQDLCHTLYNNLFFEARAVNRFPKIKNIARLNCSWSVLNHNLLLGKFTVYKGLKDAFLTKNHIVN